MAAPLGRAAPGPERGVAYPVRVGASVRAGRGGAGSGAGGRSFLTLRYDFKPDKTNQRRPGTLRAEGNKVFVKFHSGTDSGLLFTGHKSSAAPGKPQEYLLIFKDKQWRLERCREAFLNLKTQPNRPCSPPSVPIRPPLHPLSDGGGEGPRSPVRARTATAGKRVASKRVASKGVASKGLAGTTPGRGKRITVASVKRTDNSGGSSSSDEEEDDSDDDDSDSSGSYTSSSSRD